MPCTNCMAKYSVLRKEHGCTKCGYGFCQKCLTHKFVLPELSTKPVPVCSNCYRSLTENTVQSNEKTRTNSDDSGQWWGPDEKPPPSMRHLYPVKSKLLSKDNKKSDDEKDRQLTERLAKVMNKSVDEVQNPRYMISDTDDSEIPSSSAKILNNLRQSYNPATSLTNESKIANVAAALPTSSSKSESHAADSLADLEERLAALKNVPVEMIRKPRLLVTNNDEDVEPELGDDARKLLEKAEQRLRKKEPDIFYENEAWSDSEDSNEGGKSLK